MLVKFCSECSAPCFEDDTFGEYPHTGIYFHINEDGEINYNADMDHIAIPRIDD